MWMYSRRCAEHSKTYTLQLKHNGRPPTACCGLPLVQGLFLWPRWKRSKQWEVSLPPKMSQCNQDHPLLHTAATSLHSANSLTEAKDAKGPEWAAAADVCHYMVFIVWGELSSRHSSLQRIFAVSSATILCSWTRPCGQVSHRWFGSASRCECGRAADVHDVCSDYVRAHFYTALITDCKHRQSCYSST